MSKIRVWYHSSCYDGFTSAWAVRQYLIKKGADVNDENAVEFRPCSYGNPVPEYDQGDNIIIVDFSFPRDDLVRVAQHCKVWLFDHHKTAQQSLMELISELECEKIPLSNGSFAYVDKEDVPKVESYSWSEAQNGGAAVTYIGGGRDNKQFAYMHKLIMDVPEGKFIDHWNRNPLDNRKCNLRVVDRTQNAANMDRGSKFKGTKKHHNKYIAQIWFKGKNNYIGSFDTEEDAAKAYDERAVDLFGEFALLNFPTKFPPPPPNNFYAIFDMERSGAGLAWDYLMKTKRPLLVDLVEDRDLWKFQKKGSKELHAYLCSRPFDFDEYDAIATTLEEDPDYIWGKGQLLLENKQMEVEKVCKGHWVANWSDKGEKVAVCNTTAHWSEVGHWLLNNVEGIDFAISFTVFPDKVMYSLRSKGEFDVSEVAKKRGGGGHKNAAGFKADNFNLLTILKAGKVDEENSSS